MKQIYFTQSTMDSIADEFMQAASPYTRKNIEFDLSRAGLLVLDAQAYFFQPDSHAFVPSAPAIVPGVRRLVDAFCDSGRPVFFTRHINTRQDAGMMSVWWKDMLRIETPLSEILAELAPGRGIVVLKTQYDAFYQSNLERELKKYKIEQLVISGVMTHLCCDTTARSAFVKGYEVFFLVDGTATYNAELHRSSIITLAHGFALPVTVNSILQVFNSS